MEKTEHKDDLTKKENLYLVRVIFLLSLILCGIYTTHNIDTFSYKKSAYSPENLTSAQLRVQKNFLAKRTKPQIFVEKGGEKVIYCSIGCSKNAPEWWSSAKDAPQLTQREKEKIGSLSLVTAPEWAFWVSDQVTAQEYNHEVINMLSAALTFSMLSALLFGIFFSQVKKDDIKTLQAIMWMMLIWVSFILLFGVATGILSTIASGFVFMAVLTIGMTTGVILGYSPFLRLHT